MEIQFEGKAASTHEPTARHLDGLVAEQVMGWHRPTRPYQPWDKRPDLPGVMLCRQHELPRFCTDIAAAWQVVDKLRERFSVDVCVERSIARVRIFAGDRYDLLPGAVQDVAVAEAASAPVAICVAALQAVEIVDGPEDPPGRTENVAEVHELISRIEAAIHREQVAREGEPAEPINGRD